MEMACASALSLCRREKPSGMVRGKNVKDRFDPPPPERAGSAGRKLVCCSCILAGRVKRPNWRGMRRGITRHRAARTAGCLVGHFSKSGRSGAPPVMWCRHARDVAHPAKCVRILMCIFRERRTVRSWRIKSEKRRWAQWRTDPLETLEPRVLVPDEGPSTKT